MDTWRCWELVLASLEQHHDVLALTLAGHAGGPPLGEAASTNALVDSVERAMDAAGIHTAHLVGNSLGGYLAFQLAARNRATSVVAFAPAGGWTYGAKSLDQLLRLQLKLHVQMKTLAPRAESLLATPSGRRQATQLVTTNFEHIPPALIAHQMLGIASCTGAERLIGNARGEPWMLEPERIECPVRMVGHGRQAAALARSC